MSRVSVARRRGKGMLFAVLLSLAGAGGYVFAQEGSAGVSAQPLPIQSPEGSGLPLFEALNPEDTGMAGFTNDFGSPHIWGKHWRTYLFGAIGTGVALGDVDGDGRPDVFAVSKNERSRLYRNLGDFRFEDFTEASGIDDTQGGRVDKVETSGGGAAFADVNNDGHLDLYLCFLGSPNQLWINDGTGKFTEQAARWGVDVNSASVMGYFADYDRDGLLDLYVATNLLQEGDEYPGPSADHLFRNLGDTFEETTAEAGISGEGHAHSALWWDYNQDGFPDIYVANDFTGVDKLYRNQGDGTFTDVIAEASPRAPYYGMGSDFGDINGDGLYDLWVADMAPSGRERYKQTLESHRHVYESGPLGLPHQYMQNVLLLNLTGERFADVAALTGLHRTDWTWACRLVDMDNDGLLDAYVTNGMLRNFNDGDLGISLRGQNNMVSFERIFRPTPVLNEPNLAYRNLGDLNFVNTGEAWGLDKTGVSHGAAFGDLNGDGALDLVISNLREPPSVYRNRESKGNRVVLDLRGRESNFYGIGAQVELSAGDRKLVNALIPHRGYMSTDEPILHFGLGDADRIGRITVRWPSGITQTMENLQVNQRYVIHESGEPEQAEEVSPPLFKPVRATFPEKAARQDPGFDEMNRQPLLPFTQSRLITAAAAGDLNGDGKADLIVGGPSGQAPVVLLARDNFAFEEAWSLDLDEDFPSTDAGFVLEDFNGDGVPDLFAASGGVSLDPGDPGYEDRLYSGSGDGEFMREFDAPFSEHLTSSATVSCADFDADGHMDLFIGGGTVAGRYPEIHASALWRGKGNGRFEKLAPGHVPGLRETGRVGASAWADLDQDGFPELVVLPEWGVPKLWRNRGGRLVPDDQAIQGKGLSGLWTSLAVGDFDGDGRLDIAAGNAGVNVGGLIHLEEEPWRLWWKVEPLRVRLIESHIRDGEEWPLAWWYRLEDSAPGRVSRARSYSEYAEKNVAELFGDLTAQDYQRLEINEPRSGIFWQQADGSFRFKPFPPLGQSGRMVSLLAGDVNGDGISDLVASLEPLSLAPWTGRKEQGHVLLFPGSKDRMLKAELPGVSGLDVGAHSPRKLLWGDFDGDASEELAIVLAEGVPLIFGRNLR